MRKAMVWLALLLAPTTLEAMEVSDVQGGCEPSVVHKLVRQASGQLERCGATGQVVLHVSPQGRVAQVASDPSARGCLTARTRDWRIQMKEERHCTVMLLTAAGAAQVRDSRIAAEHAHPSPSVPVPPRPAMLPPTVPPTANLPYADPPAVAAAKPVPPHRLSHAEKAEARKAALQAKKAAQREKLAAKKAAKKNALAAKKAGKGDALAAKKAEIAEKRAAQVAKKQAQKAAKAAKLTAKREAKLAKQKAKRDAKAARKAAKQTPK